MPWIAIGVSVAFFTALGVALWKLLGRKQDPAGTTINQRGPDLIAHGLELDPIGDALRAAKDAPPSDEP
jgi:hypothetical protein